MFGKKFACGSTVTKEDDIEVQGDFKEEMEHRGRGAPTCVDLQGRAADREPTKGRLWSRVINVGRARTTCSGAASMSINPPDPV